MSLVGGIPLYAFLIFRYRWLDIPRLSRPSQLDGVMDFFKVTGLADLIFPRSGSSMPRGFVVLSGGVGQRVFVLFFSFRWP